MLCDPSDPDHLPGARVVAAWAGGSPDLPISIDRVGEVSRRFCEIAGISLCAAPGEVAERSDVLLVSSCDGRTHRALAEAVLPWRRPTFVDKPMATTFADAKAMAERFDAAGVPWMACSPKRFSEPVMELRRAIASGRRDDIRAVEVVGPMPLEPAMPGYFWYGIHGIDVLVSLLGPTCRSVRCIRHGNADVLLGDFAGRVGVYRGLRDLHKQFHLTLHTPAGTETFDLQAGRSNHFHLLHAVIHDLADSQSPVPPAEALAAIAIAEAGNQSLASGSAVTPAF